MEFTENEIRAVKYYMGDVSGSDPFWSEPKAYLVVNSLFYPDISTETARACEGKYLNPEILSNTERLLGFCKDLFSVFNKCSAENDIVSYRVERFSDYLICRDRQSTVSFTSTSVSGFLDTYRDRTGIALMKFRITAGMPCIQMSRVLSDYAKSDEAEVLLPPFVKLEITESEVPEKYVHITDSEGKAPKIYCNAETGRIVHSTANWKELHENGRKAGQRVLNVLNDGKVPENEDIQQYCIWKSAFVQKVQKMFSENN